MTIPVGEPQMTFHVVVPGGDEPVLADVTRRIVEALRLQAQGCVGGFVHVIAVNVARRRVWCGETGQPIAASRLATHVSRCTPSWRSATMGARLAAHAFGSSGRGAARVCVLMNAGFLLADPPPILTLTEHGKREPTWCAARSTRDTYAFGFEPRALNAEDLWAALRLLTACVGDPVEAEWARLVRSPPLAPALTFVENSPASAGVPDAWSRRTFDSPLFVNTALEELMTRPQDGGSIAGRSRAHGGGTGGAAPRLARALGVQHLDQRHRVPSWTRRAGELSARGAPVGDGRVQHRVSLLRLRARQGAGRLRRRGQGGPSGFPAVRPDLPPAQRTGRADRESAPRADHRARREPVPPRRHELLHECGDPRSAGAHRGARGQCPVDQRLAQRGDARVVEGPLQGRPVRSCRPELAGPASREA